MKKQLARSKIDSNLLNYLALYLWEYQSTKVPSTKYTKYTL